MQKVKTHEYEFLARLLSPEHLYEFRWKERIHISANKYIENSCKVYGHLYDIKDVEKFTLASAHTARSAWKKACKILNND